ncbi:sensor histidine kinase [Nocardioides humi]|uniref:histidine kinase n=1 Tax=Nocardioides humi TaxID=449461 RepID=A0ABN1ZTF3_9ACTN|nr:histidine kinase [Nocardioides humi]
MTGQRRATWALAVVAALCLATAVVFALLAPGRSAALMVAVGLVAAPLTAGLSVMIARRPDGSGDPGSGRVAVLLALVGATAAHVCAKENVRSWLATDHERAGSFVWLEAAWDQSALACMAAVGLLLLYFPDGRLPGRRWRWLPPALVAVALLAMAWAALAGEPFRPPLDFLPRNEPPGLLAGPSGSDSPPFVLVLVVLVLASAVSLVVRYRRAGAVQRLQVKWLALGGFGVALYPVVCLGEIAIWGEPRWGSLAVLAAGILGIPVGVGIAMLRHDLYGVDRALVAVVTWTLATAVLLAFYATATGLAGATAGRGSVPVAVTVTVLAVLAFAPLRAWLQRQVDRRLYPRRRAGNAAVDQLHRDVAAGLARPEQLEERLRTALRDPALRVVLDDRDGPGDGVPVELGGAVIGRLVPGPGGPSVEVLRDVAARATTMVEVVRVREELGRALREVEASRARLVQIGYDERRRLERDLHDGAQQRLVALGMSMRLAQRHLADGTVDVPGLFDEAVAEIGTAVAELRQIAHGLRPSALDDGLPAAISRLVRSLPMPIDLAVEDVLLPDDVATTAYFVIAEAVTNAVKHADATRIVLRVARDGGAVTVHVTDDGRGGAVIAPSSAMADRVAALGGRLSVRSPAGRGTTVEVILPCAS